MSVGDHIGIVDPSAIRRDISAESLTKYFSDHGKQAELIYPKDLKAKIDDLSHLVLFFAPGLPEFMKELSSDHSMIEKIIVCPPDFTNYFSNDTDDELINAKTLYQLRMAIMGPQEDHHLETVEYVKAKTHLRVTGDRFFDLPQYLCSKVPGTASTVVDNTDKPICEYCRYANSLLGGESFVPDSPDVIVQSISRIIGLGFEIDEDAYENARRVLTRSHSGTLSVQPGSNIVSDVLYSQHIRWSFDKKYVSMKDKSHIHQSNAGQLGLF